MLKIALPLGIGGVAGGEAFGDVLAFGVAAEGPGLIPQRNCEFAEFAEFAEFVERNGEVALPRRIGGVTGGQAFGDDLRLDKAA